MDSKDNELQLQIDALYLEHQDLDDLLNRIIQDITIDQLQVRRIKKRKLLLKDIIARLESKLIPDLDA